ncbi:MAG: hypothetical protein CMM47_00660 [Rhodospirillaceae bacterium]|nr:hypothetical protein [Rhodospirillaceae bacterium]MBM84483.1 hypothetical protein [Rhodospirillaceae bacterium]MBM84520.1 hypothetical protein [Rhodospirillaceae bacterium]|tara:strand:+ start:250 stop:660 length:411 start_codon:yes stop_codon:yes gene_type:complete
MPNIEPAPETAIATKIQATENASVKALQALVSALPQSELPVDHFFSDGLYLRKLTLPPKALAVGREHKHNHLAIVLKGQVAVHSKQGTAYYSAPYILNVMAGDKRAVFTVTEVEWVTIHATDLTDPDEIVRTLAGE